MKYVVGIDGGGTHCRLLACSLQGQVLGETVGNSTNIESNSIQTVAYNIKALLDDFTSATGYSLKACQALCLGTAGADTEESLATINGILDDLHLPCPHFAVNDGEIALAAQTKGGPGILIISGTGSIGVGMDGKGHTMRGGGYGHLVGDEGSGYWVVVEAIKAIFHWADGIGVETSLACHMYKALNIEHHGQLMDYVYANNKSTLAKLSPLVDGARQAGDKAALKIMTDATTYLAELGIALARKLQMESAACPFILAGGFLTHTPWLQQTVCALVGESCPNFQFQLLKKEAQWGAVYLAANHIGAKMA